MSKKLNSIQSELAGAFRSGNIFFVLYEILNLGHFLVNKLLYLMCIPLWNLSDRIRGKSKKKSKLLNREDALAHFERLVKELSAGKELKVKIQMEIIKKDVAELNDKS